MRPPSRSNQGDDTRDGKARPGDEGIGGARRRGVHDAEYHDDERDGTLQRDAEGDGVQRNGGEDDGERAGARASRSAKARRAALDRRKRETGRRRGDAKAGFGKDPPPKGGRNRRGRGR